jgi:hypothetical protein
MSTRIEVDTISPAQIDEMWSDLIAHCPKEARATAMVLRSVCMFYVEFAMNLEGEVGTLERSLARAFSAGVPKPPEGGEERQ